MAILYGITNTGQVEWFDHKGSGTGDPAGWNQQAGNPVINFAPVFGAANGVLYAYDGGSLHLFWYRHVNYLDAAPPSWTGGSVLGGPFDYTTVFSEGFGTIYGITPAGDLEWRRHNGHLSGAADWTPTSSVNNVGISWDQFSHVLSGYDGIIYAIKPNGDLEWYRHNDFMNGTPSGVGPSWENNGQPKKIGSGWDQFSQVFSPGGGILYAVKPTGDVFWYKHLGYSNGANLWANNAAGKLVKTGWNVYAHLVS